jgi:hypothetical protein
MPAYMYEDLKKMVYADDPEAVRHVGDWLGSRGRLISDFAATVHRELSKVDDLYSSAEGAPALKAQLYRAFDELQKLGGDLIQNGHVLDAAAGAIETAQGQVDAIYPDTKPGDAVFRGTNPYTDPPSQKAQPYVESLNTYMYNLTDSLALVRSEDDFYKPGRPPGGISGPPVGPGGPARIPNTGPGSSTPGINAGKQIGKTPGTIVPSSPVVSQPPTVGTPPTTPGGGMSPPATGGSSGGGKGNASAGAPAPGAGRRLRMPGSRRGDLLGRMSPPANGLGGDGARGVGEPPGVASSPDSLESEGSRTPVRPGAVPPGGGLGAGTGVPAGVHGGHSERNRRGKKKPGYERGQPDTFVDGRFGNEVGGELRAESRERPVDPGPAVIGNQKHKAAEDDVRRQWELAETTPSPDGFPEEFREGNFRGKDGVQFEVRRRVGGA